MSDELQAAVIGAIVGGALSGVLAILVFVLQEIAASRRTVRQARIALAREIIRLRGNQAEVTGALNEIPVLFGHDDELVRNYRTMVTAKNDVSARTEALTNIVIRMAKVAGAKDLPATDVTLFLY